jgi:2-phospho-L-lactate guanylyltransferase
VSAIRAIVPVKAIAQAKQRLAGVLAAAVRQELACAMLADVLDALAQVQALAGTIVVSADETAAGIAAHFGAAVLRDKAGEGHSAAVAAAAAHLAKAGEGMLTLPADVPLVSAADVATILAAAGEGRRFVIVPARDGAGSNAVLCVPADAVKLQFGMASCAPHLAAAAALGLAPVTLHLPRVALDLDGPDDLAEFLRIPSRTRARAVLERHGVAAHAAG